MKVKKEKKRPGRKVADTEAKNKRTAQNRAAQRAFRERKEAKLRALEETISVLKGMNSKKNGETEYLKQCLLGMIEEMAKYRPMNEGDQSMLKFLDQLKPDDVDSVEVVPTLPTAAEFSGNESTASAGTAKPTTAGNEKEKSAGSKDSAKSDKLSVSQNNNTPSSSHFPSPLSSLNTPSSSSTAKRGVAAEQAPRKSSSSSSWMDPIFDQELKLPVPDPATETAPNPFALFDINDSPVLTNNWNDSDLPMKLEDPAVFDFAISEQFIAPELVSYPGITDDNSNSSGNDNDNMVRRIEPKLAFPNGEIDKANMVIRRDSSMEAGQLDVYSPALDSPTGVLEDNNSELINDFTCSCQANQTSCPTRQLAPRLGDSIILDDTSASAPESGDEELRCELLTRYILHKEPLSSVFQLLKNGQNMGHGQVQCADICGKIVPRTGFTADDFENLCDELMNKAKISSDGGIIPKPQITIKAGDLQRTLAKHVSS